MWVDTDCLPLVHRVDVRRVDGAGRDQQLAGLGDRLVPGARRAGEHDRLAREHVAAEPGRAAPRPERRRAAAFVWSSSSTISSYRGLPMKLSTETWTADGVRCLRPVGQVLVGDHQVESSVRLAIALLTTVTSP